MITIRYGASPTS